MATSLAVRWPVHAVLAAVLCVVLTVPAAARGVAAQCAASRSGEREAGLGETPKPKARAPSAKAMPHASHSASSVSLRDDASATWTVKWVDGRCAVEMRARGNFTLAAELDDVARMEPGTVLELSERDGDALRVLELSADRHGRVQRTWWVNGSQREFDAEAREWFVRMATELDRRTGFAADVRIPKLLERDGLDGVLREVSRMSGDVAKGRYFAALLAARQPDARETQAILGAAGREVASDIELARILGAIATAGLVTDRTVDSYVEAAAEIESDIEHARALSTLLEQPRLSRGVLLGILKSSAGIESDIELGRVLIQFSRANPSMDEELRDAYLVAAAQVQSDIERRRVLSAVVVRSTF